MRAYTMGETVVVGQRVRVDLLVHEEDGLARVRRVFLSGDGQRFLCKEALSWATGQWCEHIEGETLPSECLLPIAESGPWPPAYELEWPSRPLPAWFRDEDVVSIHLATGPSLVRDLCGARVVCGRGDSPPAFDTIVTRELWAGLRPELRGAPILAAAELHKAGMHPWIR